MITRRTARSVNLIAALAVSAALLFGASAPAAAAPASETAKNPWSLLWKGQGRVMLTWSGIIILPTSG